jgi:hypothetical protein
VKGYYEKMESLLKEFLKVCLTDTKEQSLAFWETKILPLVKEEYQNVAHPDYYVTLDQRWWLWCERHGEIEKGRDALQRLLLTQAISWEAHQSLQKSALQNVLALPTLRKVVFAPSAGLGYLASSPFILRNPDDPTGFLVNVRHVNYRFTEDNKYPLIEEYVASTSGVLQKCVRTKNVIHVCSSDLSILSTHDLEDKTSLLKWPSPVLDLEDMRLVALPSGTLVGVAASREVVVSTLPQPVLVNVNWVKKECTRGVRLRPHLRELEQVCQKNWLPFWCKQTQRLLAFYTYGPKAILYAVEPNTGTCTIDKEWDTGLSMHTARGGAPPVPWEDVLFLSVVHTSLQSPNVRRKYFHRFVLHASDYRPVAISQQWNFSGKDYDAEFVISCARASESSYYLGYGQNDGVSNVAEVSIDTIKGLWWYKVSA